MASESKLRWAAGGAILLGLLLAPAPLLPPHRLAEATQGVLGIDWNVAYLVAAIGLHAGFYGSLGLLAALAVNPPTTFRGRLLQIVLVPLIVVGAVLVVRSAKLGHVPILVNALVPMTACLCGVALGFATRARHWKVILSTGVLVLGATLWGLYQGTSEELRRATREHLQRLVAAAPALPRDDARFGALLQTAFAPWTARPAPQDAVRDNRAAILALGIAIGHERLARYAGLDEEDASVRAASLLRQGTTLRGREDWPRHYMLSAALAVLGNPLVSDAGGLMKEQLDALTGGTGFSFGDLAADRAGVRFATAATGSGAGAEAMRTRLRAGFSVDDFFPFVADLPEKVTLEEFRRVYGGVGSRRYRQAVGEIEARLDRCAGLAAAN